MSLLKTMDKCKYVTLFNNQIDCISDIILLKRMKVFLLLHPII